MTTLTKAWRGLRWWFGSVLGDTVGTALFAVVVAIGLPLRDERAAQFAVGVVSMATPPRSVSLSER